jgi:hypothetical protein
LHKRFSSKQVGEILKKYEEGKGIRTEVEQMLEINKAQLFYRVSSEKFSIIRTVNM